MLNTHALGLSTSVCVSICVSLCSWSTLSPCASHAANKQQFSLIARACSRHLQALQLFPRNRKTNKCLRLRGLARATCKPYMCSLISENLQCSRITPACSRHTQTLKLFPRTRKTTISLIMRACSRHLQTLQLFPRERKRSVSLIARPCSHHLQTLQDPPWEVNGLGLHMLQNVSLESFWARILAWCWKRSPRCPGRILEPRYDLGQEILQNVSLEATWRWLMHASHWCMRVMHASDWCARVIDVCEQLMHASDGC